MALSIGQMAAASYDAVLNEARKPANQWADSTFMSTLEEMGGIKKKAFSDTLEETLDYQRNQGGDFLATDLTLTSTTKTEVLTAAQYSPAELSIPVVWSKGDDMKNPSENQKIAFVKHLLVNALETHDEMIEEALFTTSTDGFLGLQTLVPDSGQGTVGGISAATETFWRNYTDDYLDDASDIEAMLTDMHNSIAKGSGSKMTPNLLVSGSDPHALYESTLQPLQRYTSNAEGNGGFKKLAFKTASYIFSQYGGTRIYGLNTKALRLVVSSSYFRDKGEQKEFDNANGFVFKIYSGLQLVTNNKSRLGVLTQTAA